VQEQLADPLAMRILQGQVHEGQTVKVGLDKQGAPTFTV
jgi:ATP-dependent Clp protease ATP-binding subunit ClpA